MLRQLCVDLSEAVGSGIAEEHPFEFVSAVLTIYTIAYRPTGCHTLPRNEHLPRGTIIIGKVLSVILSQ